MPDEPLRSGRVSLERVEACDRALIEGLAQFYIYDFSEMSPISDTDFDLGADGRFSALPGLDQYWTGKGCVALCIRYDGRPAGFILINSRSHRDDGFVEHNMGEFFVARQFRHSGVADEALRQLLLAFPGQWEIAVAARNRVAKAFWPRAIGAADNVAELEQIEGDGRHWTGPIWCFAALRTT